MSSDFAELTIRVRLNSEQGGNVVQAHWRWFDGRILGFKTVSKSFQLDVLAALSAFIKENVG